MKKYLSLFIIALLSGGLTLAGYKTFFEKNTPLLPIKSSTEDTAQVVQTGFVHTPGGMLSENTDFTAAAEATVDAVVHVMNHSVYIPRNPIESFFYGRGFEQVGTGSGVIISADGYIITNNHVIANATEIDVTLNNRKTYKAKLIGTDPTNDIALIKIDASDLPYIVFGDSDKVKVGEWVLAVGNPYNLTSTVTAGIISAKGRDLEGNNAIESYLQTDAAVNPGNSGGALVNTRGELIGINAAISSKTGSYVGYSFAIPSNIARKIVEDFIEFGKIQQAYLGIQFNELDGDKADKLNLPVSEGIYVTKVLKGGAAEEAGMQEGDVIVGMNGNKITKFSELKGQLNAYRPGDQVDVEVIREGEHKHISVVLKNQFGKEEYSATEYIDNILGMKLAELNKKQKRKFQLTYGVSIEKINNEDLKRFGITKGSVLLKINKRKVNSVEEVENLLHYYENEPYVTLQILTPDEQVEYISIKLH